jgi:RHS repeat-associated protein
MPVAACDQAIPMSIVSLENSSTRETMAYDGAGHRVMKTNSSGTTVYVYDAFGKMVAEYSSAAPATPPCTTCFLVSDFLGSTRLVTDASGNPVARHDYLPFGEEITNAAGRGSQWGSTTDEDAKFTGQIRDQESGLDYFNARYFGAALGRFTSPDPGNAGADPRDPQTWNGYAYVRSNPLSNVDPTGMCDDPDVPCFQGAAVPPCK